MKTVLISPNWDKELTGGTFDEVNKKMLFCCIWKERKDGGYNNSDFRPFVAMEKIVNEGVDAYRGFYLDREKHVGQIFATGKAYKPVETFKAEESRLIISNDMIEVAKLYLQRWD